VSRHEAPANVVRPATLLPCLLACTAIASVPAMAQSAPSAPTGLWERSTLLGDMGGLRTILGKYGLTLGLSETSEVLGNPTGGEKQGAAYEGLTQMTLDLDLEKAVGLAGGTIHISGLQIHGRGLSASNLGNLNIVSGIEAEPSTRLFEWWYDQAFLGGKLDVKIGQQAADQEFMVSRYGGVFINASFGWPTLPAMDLPSGGPAYPLAAPGVRLRVQPSERVAALVGVFNGDPAGPGTGNPLQRNRSGTNFDVSSGVFVIGEVQYATHPGDDPTGLPGTYKLGAWYNSNKFDEVGLANPPGTRRGDWSVYAVMDQLVYRPAGAKDGGAGVFLRATGAPGDRNAVNVFVDGGVTYKGALGRPDDTIGLGVGWAGVSGGAGETVLELTYQSQLAPWWIVQPDFQYVFNPGGGIANPDHRVGDAAILGLRTIVTF
jgi:porin